MRRRRALVVVIMIAVALLAFFLAPVAYWFSAGPEYQAYPHPSMERTPVYRSLGCVTVGFGDTYGPGWFGLVIGCSPASFWRR